MTQNQIAYLKHLEDRRSHLAAEHQTAVRDTNSYVLGVRQADETELSHRNTERIERDKLRETNRANLANELIKHRDISVKERHNVAQEVETNRHNVAEEGIKMFHEQEVQDDHMRTYKMKKDQFNRDLDYREKQLKLGYDQLEQDYMFEKFNQGQAKQKTAQGWVSSITKGLSDLGNAASKGTSAYGDISSLIGVAKAIPLF